MNSVLQAWRDVPPVFADRLMALLSAPSRIWHGLHRTNLLLIEAERHCAGHWLRPLRWAILYRLAVFDPLATRRENAEASVELWAEHFPALHDTVHNVSTRWGEDVATAILAAADPFARPTDLLSWQHALLDLDLAWLAATPRAYEASRLLMLDEFTAAGGTAEEWIEARRALLMRAAACTRLFHIVHGAQTAAAQENIARELAQQAAC